MHTKIEMVHITWPRPLSGTVCHPRASTIHQIWSLYLHPRNENAYEFRLAFLVTMSYRKSPIVTYPTCIWRSRWGWPSWNFAEIIGIRKLQSLGYRTALFAWFYVYRFCTVPACDGRRDSRWQHLPR